MTSGHTERAPLAVWKFPLAVKMENICLMMPKGAEILHVALQGNQPTVWAKVSELAEEEARKFRVFGTGWPVPSNAVYVGTWHDGSFVWHLFELRSDKDEVKVSSQQGDL